VAVPPWLEALPESERPPLPLPRAIVFSHEERLYESARSGAPFVFAPAARLPSGRGVVRLKPFFLAKLETTNAEFAAFVAETRYRTTAERRGTSHGLLVGQDAPDDHDGLSWRRPGSWEPRPELPVVHVSLKDALAFVEWAGLRLPSEGEWTRAAYWEGGRWRRWPWGDDLPRDGEPLRANLGDTEWKRAFSWPG